MTKSKLILSAISMMATFLVSGQELPKENESEDTFMMHLTIPEIYTSKTFQAEYNRELEKIRRVYPMALRAKAILNEYEAELAKIEKKGKQKKYSKETHNDLKDQFTYSIRDLYVSEGNLLMQLVHRETNMTVGEIIKKYQGGLQSTIYSGIGNVFEQDLNAKYDPKGKNKITEIVISDILNGYVSFNPEMDVLTKAEFKKTQEEYRAKRKESKKKYRIIKHDKRRAERLARKAEREAEKKR